MHGESDTHVYKKTKLYYNVSQNTVIRVGSEQSNA